MTALSATSAPPSARPGDAGVHVRVAKLVEVDDPDVLIVREGREGGLEENLVGGGSRALVGRTAPERGLGVGPQPRRAQRLVQRTSCARATGAGSRWGGAGRGRRTVRVLVEDLIAPARAVHVAVAVPR